MKLALLDWEPLFTFLFIFMNEGISFDISMWVRNIGVKTSCLSFYILNFLFSRKGRVAELSNKGLHLLYNISLMVGFNMLKVTALFSSLLFCIASGGAQGNHLSLLVFVQWTRSLLIISKFQANHLCPNPSIKWREIMIPHLCPQIQTLFASTVYPTILYIEKCLVTCLDHK